MIHIYGFFKSLKKSHKYVMKCVARVKKEPLNYL